MNLNNTRYDRRSPESVWDSYAEAKSVAICALETFKNEMAQRYIDITVYPNYLNAYDEFNMYGLQMNIEEIEL